MIIKGALSGLRQAFAVAFGNVAKRLHKKGKVNFKLYGVTAWLANNCNTHIAQYLEK